MTDSGKLFHVLTIFAANENCSTTGRTPNRNRNVQGGGSSRTYTTHYKPWLLQTIFCFTLRYVALCKLKVYFSGGTIYAVASQLFGICASISKYLRFTSFEIGTKRPH